VEEDGVRLWKGISEWPFVFSGVVGLWF